MEKIPGPEYLAEIRRKVLGDIMSSLRAREQADAAGDSEQVRNEKIKKLEEEKELQEKEFEEEML
jgi:hypothetical protein